MKTTVDLPDDLVRSIKLRAIREEHKLKDFIAILLRRGMDADSRESREAPSRVQFPLVRCAHGAEPGNEMTPERVAELLDEGDAQSAVISR